MKKILLSVIAIIGVALSCKKAPEEVPVTSVTISQTTAEMIIGETVQLIATITPMSATDKNIVWSSSKQSVATISNSGLVTAVAEGQSTVTASAGGKSATCTIIVSKGFIEVSSITLNKNELSLARGKSETLIPTVNPSDATDPTVTWTSSDAKVASVDAHGKVVAIDGGSAVITAKAGSHQATCTVSVTVPVERVSLDQNNVTIEEESSFTLVAKITPDDATNKTVEWTSSNVKVATVDDNGKVTGMTVGTATITAKVADKQATCAVTVVKKTIPVSSITLNKAELALYKGQTETLVATVKPDDATNKTVTWSSSNTKVATVDSNGKVIAVATGSATISAKAGDKEATCSITVTIPVETVTLNKTELTIILGQKETLVATVKPDDATNKTVTWTSSNTQVATVDANGKVSSVAAGTATITAKAGEMKATCVVSVIIPVESITLDNTSITFEEGESKTLKATVTPSNATNKTVSWSSSNASVASVDQNGKVTAVMEGTATITAKVEDKQATCKVTVEKAATKITSLSFDGSALYVGDGYSYTLKVNVSPDDAVGKYTWKSSNSSRVSVSGNGNTATVTSNSASTSYTTVTVTDSRTGLSASIKVYSFINNFSWNESTGETYSGYPLITIPVGGTHRLKYSSGAGSDILNLFSDMDNFVFYEPSSVVFKPANISISPDGLVTGLKEGTTGIKPTGYISASGNRLYIKVAGKLYENEYNDTKDYANNVPYGFPMVFSLLNTSDVDWFKLQTDKTSGTISVTLSVEYSGASSLQGNEARLCKYALYDSSMQMWGSGSFSFSNSSPKASINKTVPAGPLYLKIYFDTSYTSELFPQGDMTLKLIVN